MQTMIVFTDAVTIKNKSNEVVTYTDKSGDIETKMSPLGDITIEVTHPSICYNDEIEVIVRSGTDASISTVYTGISLKDGFVICSK